MPIKTTAGYRPQGQKVDCGLCDQASEHIPYQESYRNRVVALLLMLLVTLLPTSASLLLAQKEVGKTRELLGAIVQYRKTLCLCRRPCRTMFALTCVELGKSTRKGLQSPEKHDKRLLLTLQVLIQKVPDFLLEYLTHRNLEIYRRIVVVY